MRNIALIALAVAAATIATACYQEAESTATKDEPAKLARFVYYDLPG